MSSLFAFLLATHVFAGVIGVIATFLVVLTLLKSTPNIKKLRVTSFLATLSYFISWFSGGYYYWKYYGDNVKPIIKDGDYAWAHSIVMEAKEHVFLLLPVMALVIMSFAYFSSGRLLSDSEFKSSVTFFSIVALVLAVLITLSGMIITGGAQ